MSTGKLTHFQDFRGQYIIMSKKTVAFQGAHGAYSDIACRAACPEYLPLPCETFQKAFEAVKSQKADRAIIPIENTLAGRVADVHHLIPNSGLGICGEHFERIRHHLVAAPGTTTDSIRHIHSHIHALPQCRKIIEKLGAKPHIESDTAGAARIVSEMKNPEHAAIASSLAAEIYGLDILQSDIQDADHNTTRFVIFEKDPLPCPYEEDKDYVTSFIFSVRNIPAALYKALGGFATNAVNMLKLESYLDENFNTAQFYEDVTGHKESPPLKLALEELEFFADKIIMLGSYPAHPFRKSGHQK